MQSDDGVQSIHGGAVDDSGLSPSTSEFVIATDSPKTSFVYPIRSLLTGRIKPAGIEASSAPRRSFSSEHAGKESTAKPAIHQALLGSYDNLAIASQIPRLKRRKSTSVPPSTSQTSSSFNLDEKSSGVPNYRHYPAEQPSSPFSPGSFATILPAATPFIMPEAPSFAAGPTGEPVPYATPRNDSSDYNTWHPAQVSEVAADIFSSGLPADAVIPQNPQKAPFNLSETGIVHLGPIEADSVHDTESIHAMSSGEQSFTTAVSSSLISFSHELGVRDPSSLPPPASRSLSGASGSVQSEPLVTFTFEHKEDENGHHVVVGREGTLVRCEDEPIRTPGSVQGFGVLIVVAKDEESENLVVRQVSENSTEILGFSPKYLFSLECFTDTLPDAQADVLWDNIQYLNDPDPECEDQQDSPHVFLLSGYGQPGSALADEVQDDPQKRRLWTCWCAAHRPTITPTGSVTAAPSNLIILEFELERDTPNPLYPPVESSSDILSSPDSVTTTSHSPDSESTRSSRTLVSGSDAGHDWNNAVSSSDPSPTIAGSEVAISSSASPEPNGDDGEEDWMPTPEQIFESTTNRAKPLLALERLRRMSRIADTASAQSASPSGRGKARSRRAGRRGGSSGAVGMMDIFSVLAQINEQLGAAPDLDTFLKVVVGVIKDLTQFHRVLVYQFDEMWNGEVVAELVDWNKTHDLYKDLHFPASDIPAQARQLYAISKVRLLYDRSQPTARLVARSKEDLDPPLNMTHSCLRAMSPIHIKYLGNMGVRASMSTSIMAFGSLWGLITCHSYGDKGMRVSFPVRQMLRLLSQSISRNIERLSYAQRLHTRKLINTLSSDQHPSGYIVSNADDLLGLFDADFGMLVIGEGAKLLGPSQYSQEILIMAEYLRLKQFTTIHASHIVTKDYPDLQLTMGLEIIAGMLYVPLSSGGKDFIAFLRKGQLRKLRWAGKPFTEGKTSLEPRKSFKSWSETVAGRCRTWTDEQLETAGVLALVYGKFIEVWRQKEVALQTTKLTEILLSNASHEVRTPLNHIINYLELALNGPLDVETRDNLSRSHAASKSLLFTINDLLDLTRLESGNETSFNEPFNIQVAIEDAVQLYKNEALRCNLGFDVKVDLSARQTMVVGDTKKIKTAVANLTANSLKFTSEGSITVECHAFQEPVGLRDPKQVAIEIVVQDTGCGISAERLDSIFREFEQVESSSPKGSSEGLGLGLAVVARIVEQLGGQLRVDSKLGEGSRFSFLVPFELYPVGSPFSRSSDSSLRSLQSRTNSAGHSAHSGSSEELEKLVREFSSDYLNPRKPKSLSSNTSGGTGSASGSASGSGSSDAVLEVAVPARQKLKIIAPQPVVPPIKIERLDVDLSEEMQAKPDTPKTPPKAAAAELARGAISLRVLVVEDDEINRTILSKRLTMDGHTVVKTTNGQECVNKIETDLDFDCILMDVQMPILNGFEATKCIRELEDALNPERRLQLSQRESYRFNGRLPIFAISASLLESQRPTMCQLGIDGWILKPVDFKRLKIILNGVTDVAQRVSNIYRPGCNWERGGWLSEPVKTRDSYSRLE